jgi:hypothetical protein
VEKESVKKQRNPYFSIASINFLVLCFLSGRFSLPGSSFFGGGVRVKLKHGSDVGERVLLGASLDSVGGFWSVEDTLNFVTLEEGLEI